MCDICGRNSCAPWMHSSEEQKRYEKVIDAFERARDLRRQVRDETVLEDIQEPEAN